MRAQDFSVLAGPSGLEYNVREPQRERDSHHIIVNKQQRLASQKTETLS